jgi:hypothetical protein
MTVSMPGLPYGPRPNEIQPRLRAEDFVYPLYLTNDGRVAIHLAPQIPSLPAGSTAADITAAWGKMRASDAEILREP